MKKIRILRIFAVFVIITALLSISARASDKEKPDFFKNRDKFPDIDRFMKIGYAGSPIISPDGETIYFFNNFTPTSQIFRITEQNPYPYQLTFMDEAVKYPSLSPDGRWIIFLGDEGGNEQYQLFLLDTQTGFYEKITDEPAVRYGYAVWSPDSRQIYFRANRENPKNFNVYRMNLSTRKMELLVGGDGYFGPTDVSPDGRYLVYYNYLKNVNVNLYLLDLKTGTKKLLTPHKGDVINLCVGLSADNKTLYYVTNNNPEGLKKLAAIDIDTGKTEFIFDYESPWEVEEAVINPQRTRIAVVTNEQGFGPLHIIDPETGGALPHPEFNGIASSISMGRISKIAFQLNRPTRAPDIYTFNYNTLEMKQVTHSSYAGIDPSKFIEPQLISYRSFDGLEIPAFIYLPPDWKKNMGNIPFIIHFHGGPEGQARPYFQRHFNYLLLNGYGIMTPNVRGSSGYGKEYKSLDDYKKRMDSVKDGYHAAKYLIEKGYTKKGLIGLKGGSYGGYMVMALITEYPDMWAAAYESIGLVDLVNFLKNTKAYRRKLREAEYGPLSDEEFLKSVSPIHKINRVKTPLMISHGKNDPRVPVSEAYKIIENLKKRGVEVKALIWEDEGHGVRKKENRLKLYREMMKFFDKHMKKR